MVWRSVRNLLLALVVLTLTASAYAWWWAQQSPAVAETRVRAVKLFDAMRTYSGTTALDQAREAERYGGVRILVAKETDAGREIVLAITAEAPYRTNGDGFLSFGQSTEHYQATRCYRWTPARDSDTAEHVPCPSTNDIDPATAPAQAGITKALETRVISALIAYERADSVRAALGDLTGIDVGENNGDVGVSLMAISGYANGHPVYECRVWWHDGEVKTYHLTFSQQQDGCGLGAVWSARDGHMSH